jgi:hypothetical protein
VHRAEAEVASNAVNNHMDIKSLELLAELSDRKFADSRDSVNERAAPVFITRIGTKPAPFGHRGVSCRKPKKHGTAVVGAKSI